MDHTPQSIQHVLQDLGTITLKTVFGSMGFFQEGVMFALLVQGELYLRASGTLREEFEALQWPKLLCARKGKELFLHYYRVDHGIFLKPEALLCMTRRSIQAALEDRAHLVQEQAARYTAVVDKYFKLPPPRSYACSKDRTI